jgi:glycosyltransferase involved in cell wall biosynthesis
MKKLKLYIEQVRRASNIREYPVKKDFDYTVAFIMPELNSAEGVYRSLIPSFYLNDKTTIRAIPVGISEVTDSVSINEKDYTIKRGLAELSDHIVFPFLSYSLKNLIDDLRSINPALKFSYYIDYNFYFIPDSYPFVKEYSGADIIATIEHNITLVDQVIVSNKSLYNFLSSELSKKDHIKGCKTNICYQPLFYDKSIIPDPPADSKANAKTRFGMVMNQSHFSDLNFIKGILKEFLKNHSAKAEIVLLGWNGMYKGKNYLSGINIEYHPAVSFYDYFEKLYAMNIDCFIIPAKNNKFNDTSKNVVKFYEFTRMGKPVIVPDIEPYREIVKHNDTAVLCDSKESWMFEMETFLKDPDKYFGLHDRAYNSIIEKDISDSDNIKILMDLFEIKG